MTSRADIQDELERIFPDALGPGGGARDRWLEPFVDAAYFLGTTDGGPIGRRLDALAYLNERMRLRHGRNADHMRDEFRRVSLERQAAMAEFDRKPFGPEPTPPTMPEGTIGALDQVLTEVERHAGFGRTDILLGFQTDKAFLDGIKRKRPPRDPLFRDPGHGEHTHRMQWAMLWHANVLSHYGDPDVNVANLVAFSATFRVEYGPESLYAPWHFIFDRSQKSENDCRNPESMTKFIVDNHLRFPLLSWYVNAEQSTHRYPDAERVRAYVTQLLCANPTPTHQEKELIDRYMADYENEIGRVRVEDPYRLRS